MICCLAFFFTLSFIQKDDIEGGNSAEFIEADEVANELNFLDEQGMTFSISFSTIPIYEDYLQQQSDPSTEIERTSFDFLTISSSDDSRYGVLTYNCGVKLCSSLLIKMSETVTSIELGYGMLMDLKQSPSTENVVFRFGINEDNVIIRNNLILVDLQKMALLNPVSKEVSREFVENATWPITDYQWESDEVLSIRVADSRNSEYDSLLTWYSGSRKTKEIAIEL